MNYRKAMKGVHSERRLKTLRRLKAELKKNVNLAKAKEEIKKYEARAKETQTEQKTLGFRLGAFFGKIFYKIKSLFKKDVSL